MLEAGAENATRLMLRARSGLTAAYRTTRNPRCVVAGVTSTWVRSRVIAESSLSNRGVPPQQDRDHVHADLIDQAERERLLHDGRAVQTDELVTRRAVGLLNRADDAVGDAIWQVPSCLPRCGWHH